MQPTHVRCASTNSTSKPRLSAKQCPPMAPAARPLPQGVSAHSSSKPAATAHSLNTLSASGPLPPSNVQHKKPSSRSERAPGDIRTSRHPVDASREHIRVEAKEPLPPKLPPKDVHQTRGVHSLPPSYPSPQQPRLASPRQDRSMTHKPTYCTGSFESPGCQLPASPPSARNHRSSSRHTTSLQPTYPSGAAPAKHPRDVSLLPAPGVLASRRAASPPPLRRQHDMQRMAIPVPSSASRPTKF